MRHKTLYIIAGCNGAGKTTASLSFLPDILDCTQWINADEIAKGLSFFHPESVAVAAGRLMLQRIQELLARGETFAIETTLATKSYHKLVAQAHELGYKVELLFFFLPSPECAIKRVAHRVRNGGHNIPRDVIIRRYYAGIRNLHKIYAPIVDKWTVYYYFKNDYIIVDKGVMGDKVTFHAASDVDNPQAREAPVALYCSAEERRFLDCCNRAVLKMITECALHDELVVMIDNNERPIWVRAREVLEKNPGLKLNNVEYTPVEVDIDEYLKDVRR